MSEAGQHTGGNALLPDTEAEHELEQLKLMDDAVRVAGEQGAMPPEIASAIRRQFAYLLMQREPPAWTWLLRRARAADTTQARIAALRAAERQRTIDRMAGHHDGR